MAIEFELAWIATFQNCGGLYLHKVHANYPFISINPPIWKVKKIYCKNQGFSRVQVNPFRRMKLEDDNTSKLRLGMTKSLGLAIFGLKPSLYFEHLGLAQQLSFFFWVLKARISCFVTFFLFFKFIWQICSCYFYFF